jgi:hypothetical protein
MKRFRSSFSIGERARQALSENLSKILSNLKRSCSTGQNVTGEAGNSLKFVPNLPQHLRDWAALFWETFDKF